MELDEQKPKNILLDREIKTETVDLLENVKEEPLENEDYSELLVPKHEAEEGLLENVKEEPIEEEELLIPKHEEVIEPSASNMSNNPVQKSFIETLEAAGQRKKSLDRHRCFVCSQICSRQNMKFVTMEEDKLVIMLGCVLQGTYTLDQAKLFMSGRRRVYICYVHFTEAINKIYDFFNIKNPDEITSCSSELMANLMVTVNTIYPQIKTATLSVIIYNFIRRNMSQKRRCSTNGEKSKMREMQRNLRCAVCKKSESSKNMKFVTVEEDKLVIMVGCVLRGDYTHKQAHSFISQKKNYCSACRVHFSEALNQIYKALNIKQPHEASSCSVELMTNLMITVNKICPQIEPWQFRTSLNKFSRRNNQILRSDLKL